MIIILITILFPSEITIMDITHNSNKHIRKLSVKKMKKIRNSTVERNDNFRNAISEQVIY